MSFHSPRVTGVISDGLRGVLVVDDVVVVDGRLLWEKRDAADEDDEDEDPLEPTLMRFTMPTSP